MRGVSRLSVLAAVCVAVYSQDPLRTLPKNYKLALENDVVRVIRVHYDAHERLPVHDHPKTPILYVYLSDAGPVRFKHKGDEPYDLQRL
jgi:quercetin dioxygenase-like cupin family protein